MNQFSDWTSEEFLSYVNKGFIIPDKIQRSKSKITRASLLLPDKVDWRTSNNVIGDIKDQGKCGSCWAFSANGVMESYISILTGIMPDLSEQNLVDCVYNRDGCQGGSFNDAFNYTQNKNGLNSQTTYPYVSGSKAKVYNY